MDLSEEEMRAFNTLKKEYEKMEKCNNVLFPLYKHNTKSLINLIEKQQQELQLKDTVIDEMAKSISSNDSDLCEYIDLTIKCNRDNIKSCAFCIKQYFINKVKGEH